MAPAQSGAESILIASVGWQQEEGTHSESVKQYLLFEMDELLVQETRNTVKNKNIILREVYLSIELW